MEVLAHIRAQSRVLMQYADSDAALARDTSAAHYRRAANSARRAAIACERADGASNLHLLVTAAAHVARAESQVSSPDPLRRMGRLLARAAKVLSDKYT